MNLGATWHINPHSYELLLDGSVFMENDYALEVIGTNNVKIKIFNGSIHTFKGPIRHVKGLKKNLLSIG